MIASTTNLLPLVISLGVRGMRNFLLLTLLAFVGCHKKFASMPTNALPLASTYPPIAISFTADPLAIDLGQSIVLNWRSTHATSVSIDGIGDVPVNGTQIVSPATSTTFHLFAKGDGGTAEANLRVLVRVPLAPGPPLTLDASSPLNIEEAYVDAHSAKDTQLGMTTHKRPTRKLAGVAPPSEGWKPDIAEQIHGWIQTLRLGTIEHHVLGTMYMGEEYPASVTIHPPKEFLGAPALGTSSGSSVPAVETPSLHPLRISSYMKVELSQDANPGTFEIKPAQVCKLVPLDADTTFMFTVKPLVFGNNKELQFTTYVLYGDDTSSCAPGNLKVVPLESAREVVVIAAIDAAYDGRRATVAFLTDPGKWFKYVLPGGAGFAALAKLVGWWKSRKKPPASVTPNPPRG